MSNVELLPSSLREQSISKREIVLPLLAALEAIDFFESREIQILGWEGWIKDAQGRVGHAQVPFDQGGLGPGREHGSLLRRVVR